MPSKKDEKTGILYPEISLIQVGFISEQFELNIEAIKKFEPFRFNESWVNCRRASGIFIFKCQGDRLYSSKFRSLHRGVNYIILTKEGMKEGIYYDELLKLLLSLKLENFQGSTTVETKFAKLFHRDEEKQARLRMTHILPSKD